MKRLVWLACLILMGCQSAGRRSAEVSEAPQGTASKLLVLWSESVLREGEEPLAQGFVARVYLVASNSSAPIAAEGEFVVTARPVAGKTGSPATPRQWKFTSEEAAKTLREDPLGWGYSFWLPWGPPVSSDVQCALAVQFVPRSGSKLTSESTVVHLPVIDLATLAQRREIRQFTAEETMESRRARNAQVTSSRPSVNRVAQR